MEEVKRIYVLLLHSNGYKIKDIAKELNLDKYYVANVMFSSENIPYWYQDSSSLWFAKEGAMHIDEEPVEDKLTAPLVAPKVINVERFLKRHPSASLRSYLNQLTKYRFYSDDEIKELFKRYRNGDNNAYELIVKSYLKTVVGFAFLYSKDGILLEDLIQEGNIGLLRAIEHYDHLRVSSFNNYARSWILQAISFSVSYLPYTIKLPINQYSLYYKIRKFIEKYEQQNGYPPSVDDIEIDNYDNPKNISFICSFPDSLKEITHSVDDLDVFENDTNTIDVFEDNEYYKYLAIKYLNCLDKRQQYILIVNYGIDCMSQSLSSIGESLSLTRERARQIKEKSIKRLRAIHVRIEKSKNNEVVDLHELEKELKISQPKNVQQLIEQIEENKSKKMDNTNKPMSNQEKQIKTTKKNDGNGDIPRLALQNNYHSITLPKKKEPKQAEIGDRIIYGKRKGTVIEMVKKGSKSRLIIKYDNEIIDNVNNDPDLYTVL